jgi:hypothetical protein
MFKNLNRKDKRAIYEPFLTYFPHWVKQGENEFGTNAIYG